jgi:methyl acetate hydrolase
MHQLDRLLKASVEQNHVPFVVAMAGRAAGITYSGAAGPGAGPDTVFRVFSFSKAIGTMAAMMLIERGELSLDTLVVEILPEFGNLQVLDGFDGKVPRLRAPRVQATIRHLATHTSGLEYEFWNAGIARYLRITGHPGMLTGLKAALNYPMASDPGTRWGYGMGIDWLGQVVEAVDGRRIDVFCAQEIFDPLGMTSTGFEADPARLAGMYIRAPDGHFAPFDLAPPSQPEVYGMGHALYSTAPDYMRFLRMILNKGVLDGNRVLSEASVAVMQTDQMRGLSFQKMVTAVPLITADFDPFPGAHVTHSFGFLRNEADIPGHRAPGSLGWAGVCNTHYWIDPARDVAAVFMTQSLPFAEARVMRAFEAFERGVYAGVGMGEE